MRATRVLLNAAKKANTGPQIPVEMYPLFAAVAVACGSACFFTYRHFAYDRQLRIWKNPDLSKLDDVLNDAEKK